MKSKTILLWIAGFAPILLMIYLGNTGIANDAEIIYAGKDVNGKFVTVKGCRPDRVLPSGQCDRSFRWSQFWNSR